MPVLLAPSLSRFPSLGHLLTRLGDRIRFRRNARLWRRYYSRWGHCFRCYATWNRCSEHITMHSSTSGCFALCESCWMTLTPVEKLPYYADLMRLRIRQGSYPNRSERARVWDEISEAVIQGK